jgi:predicted amidophosphoribosyltransferase
MALFNTSKDVSNKAKDVATTAKLKSQITMEEGKLRGLYADLGKAYYENPEDENIEAYKDSISAVKELIESYEKQLADQKGLGTCPNCGATIAKDVAFCSKCGTKIETESQEEQTAEAETDAPETKTKHCPVCDAEVTEDMAFCEVCGHKLED